jgi:E3 ubiquitin-protein ligase SHPRH
LLAKGGKGGEMIEKEDLWDCLFCGIGQRNVRTRDNHDLRFDELEVRRHLAAEAAEERLVAT